MIKDIQFAKKSGIQEYSVTGTTKLPKKQNKVAHKVQPFCHTHYAIARKFVKTNRCKSKLASKYCAKLVFNACKYHNIYAIMYSKGKK